MSITVISMIHPDDDPWDTALDRALDAARGPRRVAVVDGEHEFVERPPAPPAAPAKGDPVDGMISRMMAGVERWWE